jgi:nucleotidyltransferase substrate binding protein (TIGR01987 family)
MDIRSQQRFANFKALAKYEEAIRPNLSRLEEEGLIQRFEYTFELAWKALQDLLQERGYANVRGPKPVIEQAFQDGIISEGPLWLEMLKSRNETTHLYDEATFERISSKVRGPYFKLLQAFEKSFPTAT